MTIFPSDKPRDDLRSALEGARVGKRFAGRLVDGTEHNAFPEIANG